MGRIPCVGLAGTPVERGYQHGRALAGEIARTYHLFVADTCAGADPPAERDLIAYALGHLPESRAYAPDLVEEVEGIARGADMPFEKLWLLNAWDEADAFRLYRDVNAGRGCTSFAATGASTPDGRTYIGQNWDIPTGFDPVILKVPAGDGEPGARIFTYPGTLAGCGINDAGIAIVINTMRSLDARNGVIWTFLIRRVLQQSKLSDALLAAVSGVRAESFHFIIGAEFAALDIEATAARERVRYISGHYGHANHFEERDLLPLEGSPASAPHSTTRIRGWRMGQLLDESAGRLDVKTLQTILSDHANYPGSICAHVDPPHSRVISRAGLIYDPARRRMLATNGQPCSQPWLEY